MCRRIPATRSPRSEVPGCGARSLGIPDCPGFNRDQLQDPLFLSTEKRGSSNLQSRERASANSPAVEMDVRGLSFTHNKSRNYFQPSSSNSLNSFRSSLLLKSSFSNKSGRLSIVLLSDSLRLQRALPA